MGTIKKNNPALLKETSPEIHERGKSSRTGMNRRALAPSFRDNLLERLAACSIDSLSSIEVPAIGYGIRYEFGIFKQGIQNGWQVAYTAKWLQLGGRTEGFIDEKGNFRVRRTADPAVLRIPWDTPIPGYKVNTCNLLRLRKAEACESFDFQFFNVGDCYGAAVSLTGGVGRDRL
jgi:glycogen phosphorylase